jgi:hypothetical protein
MRAIASFILAIALFVIVAIRLAPPIPISAHADSSTFSAHRAYKYLNELLGNEVPHPSGSPANATIRKRLIEQFRDIGYEPEVQSGAAYENFMGQLKVHNVIATLPGSAEGGTVLLSAHYDSVSAGPGASDDGVAVAALLEVARIAKDLQQLRNTVVFLISDGEEMGLCGAKAFLREHPLAEQIDVVINFEARGTSGSSLMFETSGSNEWLIDVLGRAVKRPVTGSVFTSIYERLPNGTDLSAFEKADIPGLNFAFIGDPQNYHTSRDDLAHVTLGSMQHHGDNALALMKAFGDHQTLGLAKTSGQGRDAVFFDVLSTFIVQWPANYSMWIAIILLFGTLAITCKVAMQRKDSSLRFATIPAIGCILLPPAFCYGGAILMKQMGWAKANLVADTTGYSLMYWSLSFIGLWVATRVAKSQTSRWSLWSAAWLSYGVLAVVTSHLVVGASYLFILPLGVALVSAGVDMKSGRQLGAFATILPILAAGIVWFPLHQMIPTAMGIRMGWLFGSSHALFLLTTLPTTARPKPA